MLDRNQTHANTAYALPSQADLTSDAVAREAATLGQSAPQPARPRLSLDEGWRLWLDQGGTRVRVTPLRCFPWSAPGELVSLRDEHGAEQLLIEQPAQLDTRSAAALASALVGSGFVLEVLRVESIEEDYELRIWHTETRHGKRTFQTKLDEWPWESPDGGHLVRDLSGDLFRLPPLETLDEASRKWLWAYVG